MNTNGQIVDTLASSPMFREYERAYSEATGLPVTLRHAETWKVPLHGKRNESPWCSMMAGRSGTCAACLRMQERLAHSALNHACTLSCTYGLCETAVPVKLGAETIGYLQTGQVMRQAPTEASFDHAFQQAQQRSADLVRSDAREAYFNTPVIPPKKMESISKLLGIFSEHLSIKSNQLAMQTANAEPPIVTRARKFIEEHHTEDLSLGQVAQAVHASIFYLCKLFRKATGINFTEYVSRVRTEKAKHLLSNPNLRVSEIAYEVGFQSLTHFNRVFRKLVGESPTKYRGRLPKTA